MLTDANHGAPLAAYAVIDDDGPLYVARRKIYPKAVSGFYRSLKWKILIVTLAIYYFTPLIRWDRGPGAPDQAVLVDIAHNRFYFFFIEIWPQEVYYLTGLLILAALTLFLMNAVAGRMWCGYLCPQTVWTDLFFAVERLIEGDQREQTRLKSGGWTLDRFAKAIMKHWAWLMIAWWTGGAWVLYFSDAPTLIRQLATFQAPWDAYIWMIILTATTYVFAGHMREQVCTYMCPWPRIQAALTDEHALNVTYRYDRGDPRTSFKKSNALRLEGVAAGDCIDCNQCVAVCPTGIDIRDGAQLACIQCGLCIDACDNVMRKIGRPARLIAYDNEVNIHNRQQGRPEIYRIIRPRTIVYALVMVIVGSIMLAALISRVEVSIKLIHDRNPQFVKLASGAIRNAYALHLLNKTGQTRTFLVSVDGIKNAQINIGAVNEVRPGAGTTVETIEIGPDQTREVRIFVSAPAAGLLASSDIVFRIQETNGGLSAVAHDTFKAP